MQLNKVATSIEKGFNIAGSLPVVGIFSGSLRVTGGKIQVVAGLLFGIIGLVGMMIRSHDFRWERMAKKGAEHIIHGLFNIARGWGETLLAATLIGSVIPLTFNLLNKPRFEPWFKYGYLFS